MVVLLLFFSFFAFSNDAPITLNSDSHATDVFVDAVFPAVADLTIDTFTLFEDGLIVTGALTVNDTLIIYGDLVLANKAEMHLTDGAVCIVYGNVDITNKIVLDFNSHFIVTGSLIHQGSEDNVDLNVADSASIYILGDVDEHFPTMVCDSTTVANYEPPGDSAICERGDIISLEDNENNEGGLYDLISSGDSLKGITPVYSEICGGESVTISAVYDDADFYFWCDSIGDVIDSTSGFEYTTSEVGEYFVKIVDLDNPTDTIVSFRAKILATVDTIPPDSITMPDVFSDCPVLLVSPVTTDNCDGTVVGQLGDTIGTFQNGYSVEWIFTDLSGNSTVLSQNVNLIDNTIPLISCIPDTVVEASTGSCEAYLELPVPTYSDNCGVDSIFNSFSGAGFVANGNFPLGVTEVVYTVIDLAGNSSSCTTQVVVIQDQNNIIAAGFSTQSVVVSEGETLDFTSLNTNPSATYQWSFPGANIETSSDPNPSGIFYPISGTYTITHTVSNNCIELTKTLAIQVVTNETTTYRSDSIFVVPNCVSEIIVEAWGGGGAGGGSSDPGNSGVYAGAGGGAGGYAQAVLKVSGGDTLNVIVGQGGSGSSAEVGEDGGFSSISGYETQVFAAGGFAGQANTTGVSPQGGNGGTVNIGDVTGDGGAGGNGGTGFISTAGSGGDSPSGGSGGIGQGVLGRGDGEPGNPPPGGGGAGSRSITIFGSGEDFSGGNGADGEVVLTWMTDTPPSFTIDSVPAIAGDDGLFRIYYSDTDGGPVTYSIDFDQVANDSGFVDVEDELLTSSPLVISAPVLTALGSYSGTLTLKSLQGCVGEDYSINILIKDTDPPNIVCPEDITVGMDEGYCYATNVDLRELLASDNSIEGTISSDAPTPPGRSLTIFNDAPDTFYLGTTIVTWTVQDDAGNEISCQQNITVEDNQLPDITCPADIIVDNDPGLCSAVVNYTIPVGTDNCTVQGTELTSGLGSGAAFPVGVSTETYVVTDQSGNTDTCSFTITVNSTLEANITIEAADTVICSGASVTFTSTTVNGGGSPSYQWKINGVNIAGETNPNYTTSALINGDVVSCQLTSSLFCVTNDPVLSNSIVIQVIDVAEGGTTSPDQTICEGNPALDIVLTGSSGSIQWQLSTDNVSFIDISGATDTVLTSAQIGILSVTSYYRALVDGETCGTAFSDTVTISVNQKPAISLDSNEPEACVGDVLTGVGYSSDLGNPDTYSIDFDAAAEAEGFVDVVDASLAPAAIEIDVPVNAAAADYNAIISVKNSASNCTSTDYSITIHLYPLPDIGEIITDTE